MTRSKGFQMFGWCSCENRAVFHTFGVPEGVLCENGPVFHTFEGSIWRLCEKGAVLHTVGGSDGFLCEREGQREITFSR